MIKSIIDRIVDLAFPPRCAICNELLSIGERGSCYECRDKLTFVVEPYCMKCGKPLDNEELEYCSDCSTKEHSFDEGRAALVYDEYISRSIYRFKYNSKQEYAAYYAQIIYDRLRDKIKSWNPEALIPVPIHKNRMKKRGYNQAYLIAKELSKLTGIPVENNLVKRKNETKVQKELGARERENNLKKAFIVNKNVVELKSVVIIDDIYTTGSTVDSIASLLKEKGVRRVYFISLSIGRGY